MFFRSSRDAQERDNGGADGATGGSSRLHAAGSGDMVDGASDDDDHGSVSGMSADGTLTAGRGDPKQGNSGRARSTPQLSGDVDRLEHSAGAPKQKRCACADCAHGCDSMWPCCGGWVCVVQDMLPCLSGM